MLLTQMYALFSTAQILGASEVWCADIQCDSRKVKQGDLFFCLSGYEVDGHFFAHEAISKGAIAIVTQRKLDVTVPQLIVKDSRFAMAIIANCFFKNPSQHLKVIGITGTNGKTTTAYLIEKILNDHRINTGLMGTIEHRYNDNTILMETTTLGVVDLQRSLYNMVVAGVDSCVMEVSSHALQQGRVIGTHFRTAVFTNMTQDHLDYHASMEDYRSAKQLLFSRLGNTFSCKNEHRQYAVLNADDPAFCAFQQTTAAEVITYGIESDADVRATSIVLTSQGTSFYVNTYKGGIQVQLNMVGKFNIYNALAAITVALIEQVPLFVIKQSLEKFVGVKGRVEIVNEGQPFTVIVDYAHTPDGVRNVLESVKQFAQGRILCVFGCGGDRDRTKRPLMGKAAVEYSDMLWITSDNPRTEKPECIARDVEQGLIDCASLSYRIELDRKVAIEQAIAAAKKGDVVLILGKGHETYQILGTTKFTFDDRMIAKEAIRSRM